MFADESQKPQLVRNQSNFLMLFVPAKLAKTSNLLLLPLHLDTNASLMIKLFKSFVSFETVRNILHFSSKYLSPLFISTQFKPEIQSTLVHGCETSPTIKKKCFSRSFTLINCRCIQSVFTFLGTTTKFTNE